MSERTRRTFLKGAAGVGISAAAIGGLSGTAAADGYQPNGFGIQGREDNVNWGVDIFHPDDGSNFEPYSGTLDDGETTGESSVEGIISRFYADGDAALYRGGTDEQWYRDHKVINPQTKTIRANGEVEYTLWDGTNTEYSGTLANSERQVELDQGVAIMLVRTPQDGSVILY